MTEYDKGFVEGFALAMKMVEDANCSLVELWLEMDERYRIIKLQAEIRRKD